MITAQESKPTGTTRWGWRILLAASSLLALNGVMLYFFIADSAADSALMQTASVLEIGLGLLALVIAWEGARHGSRWAWKALWVFVALLAALTAQLLANGEGGIALWYLTLAIIALAGQLLVARGEVV